MSFVIFYPQISPVWWCTNGPDIILHWWFVLQNNRLSFPVLQTNFWCVCVFCRAHRSSCLSVWSSASQLWPVRESHHLNVKEQFTKKMKTSAQIESWVKFFSISKASQHILFLNQHGAWVDDDWIFIFQSCFGRQCWSSWCKPHTLILHSEIHFASLPACFLIRVTVSEITPDSDLSYQTEGGIFISSVDRNQRLIMKL